MMMFLPPTQLQEKGNCDFSAADWNFFFFKPSLFGHLLIFSINCVLNPGDVGAGGGWAPALQAIESWNH